MALNDKISLKGHSRKKFLSNGVERTDFFERALYEKKSLKGLYMKETL